MNLWAYSGVHRQATVLGGGGLAIDVCVNEVPVTV